MPTSEELTDAYLAELLAKEAKQPGNNRRTDRPRDAPKPNVRFLRNVIRETDNHNAVLLERERLQADRNLKRHRTAQPDDHHDNDKAAKRSKHERPGRWTSILSQQGLQSKDDKKLSRLEPHRHHQSSSDLQARDSNRLSRSASPVPRRRIGDKAQRTRSRSPQLDRHNEKDRRGEKRLLRSRSPRPSRRDKNRLSRSRSPRRKDDRLDASRMYGRSHDERLLEHHSRSPTRSRSTRLADHRTRSPKHRERSPKRLRRLPTEKRNSLSADGSHDKHEHDSDSDPLEAIVGPLPPPKVKPRGRGATSTASGIDARFADPSYDPAKDTHQDADDDDWDMALSALQDRNKWRAIGAERLRAAGFNEADVAKWQAGSGLAATNDEDIENVVWNKRGEARDWDRGKIVQPDGHIATKAPWSSNDA